MQLTITDILKIVKPVRDCQTGKQCFIPNTLSILLTGDNPSQKERPQSSVGFGNFTTLKGKLQF